MKVTSTLGNQKKPPRYPDNLMPTTWSPDLLMASFNIGKVSRYENGENCYSAKQKIWKWCEFHAFYNCRESSTNRPYFMQNKANLLKSQIYVRLIIAREYEKKIEMDIW